MPPRNHFSILRPSIKQRVDSMVSRFQGPSTASSSEHATTAVPADLPYRSNSSSTFLLLSATDILTILDALFPQSFSSPMQTSPVSAAASPWSSGLSTSYKLRPELHPEPGFCRLNPDLSPRPASQSGSIFSMESATMSLPENSLAQTAARVRFELTDLDDSSTGSKLEHPADENWTVFSISNDGHNLTWSLLPDCETGPSKGPLLEHDDDAHSSNLGLQENHEALQTAIIRLVKENHVYDSDDYDRTSNLSKLAPLSLRHRFNQAMASANNYSDFVDAHYWWNASRQLRQGLTTEESHRTDDSWILGPMHNSCMRSLDKSRLIIERCESNFVSLDQSLRRLQTQIKDLMTTIVKVRNKMWYMTDVKNSMKYEEARHVAMALKTMIYSARPSLDLPEEPRPRAGGRSIGGGLFQKPELQVMNMMKAPSSQGGPKKLSDDQVELTRKWLAHNGIENFCKGEERIHRFCYEVRNSINRLVGETMSETPVLWASELFQRERAKYEGYATRTFPGLSMPTTPRPSTTASEDPLHTSIYGGSIPIPDPLSRLSQDTSSLGPKPSIQSLISDKWRPQQDLPSIDVSSVGGSPGRAASTSTGDTCSTFWSTPQRHPMYAASVSSVYSRPPSMFSETATRQPRRSERKPQGKTVFMDDLRQTLTSLLLSDLGSPVWSCGSETDAWFTNTLDQTRIRMQMQRRAAIQKFYTDYEERSRNLRKCRSSGGRRSRSLDILTMRNSPREKVAAGVDRESSEDSQSSFSYKAVFHRLIEVFSRHGNPFVKLNALRDLRSLVVASLNSHDADSNSTTAPGPSDSVLPRPRTRKARHSFSESRATIPQTTAAMPTTSPPESVTCGSRRSDYSTPSEDQIVTTLRDLILEVKPKTLFRDLQFISAFVPGDQLSQSDRGTAFLQFGLAALSLKDEVCHSMVEIADRIVSQELTRRHPLPGSDFYPRPGQGIEDAAAMWIITAKEGNPVAQRELAILYLTHPELLPRVTLPLTRPRDTFKAEMMYMRGKDSKSDPQSMCLALHWMQLSATGGDTLARNRLREREEFDSIA
ncbi:Chromatin assembly factor 1 subunit A [Penicillium capsulatum]|uniref:Chromatin assembly factor 1 subunit A n=1 Tax=Penicillium capsulatum TaxID=69766 RepID=A0A9W9IPR0_9EURO|nr:Chromatin assembly factor 1 subunit A [Penicillium capsulatum]